MADWISGGRDGFIFQNLGEGLGDLGLEGVRSYGHVWGENVGCFVRIHESNVHTLLLGVLVQISSRYQDLVIPMTQSIVHSS